jgi:glucosamine-phosphate N-acetyltransferase
MFKNKPKIRIKELEDDNLNNSFFETLSNLAEVGGDVYNREFSNDILEKIKRSGNIKVFVAFNGTEIIGSITIIIEQKFIHNGGKVCHIEDVVIRKGFENLGIGSILIEKALELAVQDKCYKVILNCSRYNSSFYEKFGFYKHDIGMRYDIDI